MLAALLSASLAAAPTPAAPPGASLVVHVPKLFETSSLLPFFEAAGRRAMLLRPSTWRAEAHPLLELDVTNPGALRAVGVDPAGALTVSRLERGTVSCVTVGDAEVYGRASRERLQRLGDVTSSTLSGATVLSARDALGRVLAATASRGARSCAMRGLGESIEAELPELARAVGHPATGPGFTLAKGLRGPATLMVSDGGASGAVALSAVGTTLDLDARTQGLALAPLAGGGPTPFAKLSTSGLGVLRARVQPGAMPLLVRQLARRVPGLARLESVADEIAPQLTGNVAVVVSQVQVTRGLRTPAARYFAVRQVWLAQVRDTVATRALLDAAGVSKLASADGTIEVGLRGDVLYVSNDAAALREVLATLGAAGGKQAHGLEVGVDPKRLAAGLAQVPLLEAVQAPELAALVAVATELGPLLTASKRLSAWVDSAAGGQHRVRATWELATETAPQPPAP